MVKAYVMVTVDSAHTKEVVKALRQNPRLKEVSEVLGPFDIVVVLEAAGIEQVSSVLREDIRPLNGVLNTLTCVVLD
ncbi:MAG: Lrp/AsnC ligand binding domain-containing protein [Chloroflexi bacterium]|nr:Lrp/AsnC ligand binding domain-containing protein [Chloroflexota bacterium]